MLRPGPVTEAAIAQLLGPPEKSRRATVEAPGQLAKHYSPGKPVHLDRTEPLAGSYMIGFGAVEGDCTLSASGDLAEAAARLYACLHRAAAAPHASISVAPIPGEGIGQAINDRLRRAAS